MAAQLISGADDIVARVLKANIPNIDAKAIEEIRVLVNTPTEVLTATYNTAVQRQLPRTATHIQRLIYFTEMARMGVRQELLRG